VRSAGAITKALPAAKSTPLNESQTRRRARLEGEQSAEGGEARAVTLDSSRTPSSSPLLGRQSDLKAARFEGHIDFYGRYENIDGWFLGGWSNPWSNQTDKTNVIAYFEDGKASGEHLVAFYRRDDVGERGLGFVLFIKIRSDELGELVSLEIICVSPNSPKPRSPRSRKPRPTRRRTASSRASARAIAGRRTPSMSAR
jgi:hypothetical protein